MKNKLDKYYSMICRDLPNLARILDPRFSNDIIEDGILLRKYITLKSDEEIREAAAGKDKEKKGNNSFIISLLDEDSLQGIYEDEITLFLRNTAVGDRRADPLDWWKINEGRFPSIAKLAKSTLCINASSVASECSFSTAGLLVSDLRSKISDENLSASMLMKSWERFLDRLLR